MKPLNVLALVHEDLVPPENPGNVDLAKAPWKMEYDVVSTLRERGHEVRVVGVRSDLGAIREGVREWAPDVAFNLLEEFDGVAGYDYNIVAYLELLQVAYTGCNPRGLLLARDKALAKKILAFHRIRCPRFTVIPRGRAARRPRRLPFPLIVKALAEDASVGISQASVVENDEKLAERVAFVHESVGSAAIVEEFVDGREFYVGVLGNRRLDVFPVWELTIEQLPPDAHFIATERVKFSDKTQQRYDVRWGEARELPAKLAAQLQSLAKRVYRAVELTGYARIDFRLDRQEGIWVLEANPNPDIGYGAELPESAAGVGLRYGDLLQRILSLGLRYHRERSP